MVKDMKESLRFYQDVVGLDVRRKLTAWPKTEIVFLGDGADEVELVYEPGFKTAGNTDQISLAFEVKSVDKRLQDFNLSGYKVESGPFEPNQHIKFFYVRDPNGIRIQFTEKRYPK